MLLWFMISGIILVARCIPFLFYICLVVSVVTRTVLHILDEVNKDLYSGRIIYSFVLEVIGNVPQYSVYNFAVFLYLFPAFEVFCDDNSCMDIAVDLLLATVD